MRFTSFDRLPNLTCTLAFVGWCILLHRSSILHLSLHNFASCSSVLSALFGVCLLPVCPFGIAKLTRTRDRHLLEYCQRTIGQRYRGTRRLLDERPILYRFCFVSHLYFYSTSFHHSIYALQRKGYDAVVSFSAHTNSWRSQRDEY